MGIGAPDEDEAMVDSPLESLLKNILKAKPGPSKIKKEPTTPSKITKEPAIPGPLGVKKEIRTPKRPIPPKPSTLQTPSAEKRGVGFKKTVLSGATKGFLKSLCGKTTQKSQEDRNGETDPIKRKLGYDKN